MKKFLATFGIALALISVNTYGRTYIYVSAGENHVVWLDKQTVIKDGNFRYAWSYVYNADKDEFRGLREEYDCKLRRISLMAVNYLTPNGKIKSSRQWDDTEWHSPMPDTLGEDKVNVVCGKANPKNQYDFASLLDLYDISKGLVDDLNKSEK